MSAQGHATPGDAAASHDDHFEGIPADRPGPDEPRTPLWLPLVGLGLLLATLLAYVMTRPPGKTGVELAQEASPEAAAAAPSASAPTSPRVRRLPPGLGSMFPPGAAPPGAMPPGATPPGAAPRPMMSAPARPLRPPTRIDPGAQVGAPRTANPKPPAAAQ